MAGPSGRRAAGWLRHLVLVPLTAVVLYPVLWVLRTAFSPGQGYSLSLSPIPADPTLEQFRAVLGHPAFGVQLVNSVVVAAGATVLGVFLATTAAYAFSRHRFPGRRAGLLGFLVSQMFPGVLMMIPLYVLLDVLGLLDALLGLVLVYAVTAIPFCVWTLKGWFDTLPRDLEEAALVDGASQAVIFWRIVLPLSRPAVAVTALFSFMTAWNEFILAATFMNDERSFTLPVVLQRYVGEYSTEWGHFAAGAVLVSLPVVALFYALQRHLVSGLTAGAVKG